MLDTILNCTTKNLFRRHPKLFKLSNTFFARAKAKKTALFTWIDKQYSTEKSLSTDAEVWGLEAGYIWSMFEDLVLVRKFSDDDLGDPVLFTSIAIWHLGSSLMCFQSFVDAKFRDHAVCQAVYTLHMNKSRATKAEFTALKESMEAQIKNLQKKLFAATKKISALKKKASTTGN